MNPSVWSEWEDATMRFNEADLGGWIRQPSNTFTNLAYLAVAALIVSMYRRELRNNPQAAFPVIAALVGISSFLYHASATFFFQVLDLSSMYLLSSLLVALNLQRLLSWRDRTTLLMAGSFSAASLTLLLILRHRWGAIIFGIAVLMALSLEIALLAGNRPRRPRYRDLLAALLLFALSWGFWLLDFSGRLGSPDNHVLQGHGAWHLLNSLCFFFLYRFYRQFRPAHSAVQVK